MNIKPLVIAISLAGSCQALAMSQVSTAPEPDIDLNQDMLDRSEAFREAERNTHYDSDYISVTQRQLSPWFKDAKLGIFIHYGVYTVPAYANPQGATADAYHNPIEAVPILLQSLANDRMMPESSYAEWYGSSLFDYKSTTHKDFINHHFDAKMPINDENLKQQYYKQFTPLFNEKNSQWNPNNWVSHIKNAGAKYSVLTAKHHDGVSLFPTHQKHDRIPEEHQSTQRDIVGEFFGAMREEQLRAGVYYSSYYDWSARDYFHLSGNPSKGDLAQTLLGDIFTQCDPEIEALYESHLIQLIENYNPDVIWSDIAHVGDPHKIQSALFNANPDAVTNNRWIKPGVSSSLLGLDFNLLDVINHFTNNSNQRSLNSGPNPDNFNVYPYDVDISSAAAFNSSMQEAVAQCNDNLVASPLPRYAGQFRTPEYADNFPLVKPGDYFEANQGFGLSFAYNASESIDQQLGTDALAKKFIDIVSAGGNLLLNMAIKADGSVPENQVAALEGIGKFINQNELAIYGTRPWREKGRGSWQGHDMRYTTTVDGKLNVFLMNGFDKGMKISIPEMMVEPGTKAVHLASGTEIIAENKKAWLLIDSVELDFRNIDIPGVTDGTTRDPATETNIEVIQFKIKKDWWANYLVQPNHWTTPRDNTDPSYAYK